MSLYIIYLMYHAKYTCIIIFILYRVNKKEKRKFDNSDHINIRSSNHIVQTRVYSLVDGRLISMVLVIYLTRMSGFDEIDDHVQQ